MPSQCPGPASLSWAPGSSSPCLPLTPPATPGPQPPTLKGAMVARPRARSCFLREACSPEEPPGSQLARSCTPQGRLNPREVLEGIRWPNGPGGSWQRRELGSGPGRPLCPRLCSALSAAFSLLPAEGPAARGAGGPGSPPCADKPMDVQGAQGCRLPSTTHPCARLTPRLLPGVAEAAPFSGLTGTRPGPGGALLMSSRHQKTPVGPRTLCRGGDESQPSQLGAHLSSGHPPSLGCSSHAHRAAALEGLLNRHTSVPGEAGLCWRAHGSVPGAGARPPPCALGQHRPPL